MNDHDFPRSYWHTHISLEVIHVAWGSPCPGEHCEGLAALTEDHSVPLYPNPRLVYAERNMR